MPEEDLETAELKEQIDQRLEDHEHHGHGKPEQAPGWLRYLSLSTAMIAVFAAVASLESRANSNEAILKKSEAMLNQARASDEWAYFQAKGIKATLSEDFADSLADGALKAKLTSEGKRYRGETAESKTRASKLDDAVKEDNAECDALMEHHHRFAISVTLLQIAIALSAIAALTRRKPLWFLGMAVSAGGVAMFLYGFVG
jgi:Domain of unknown function (DUF4337)